MGKVYKRPTLPAETVLERIFCHEADEAWEIFAGPLHELLSTRGLPFFKATPTNKDNETVLPVIDAFLLEDITQRP
jgi:hypothetical protein